MGRGKLFSSKAGEDGESLRVDQIVAVKIRKEGYDTMRQALHPPPRTRRFVVVVERGKQIVTDGSLFDL